MCSKHFNLHHLTWKYVFMQALAKKERKKERKETNITLFWTSHARFYWFAHWWNISRSLSSWEVKEARGRESMSRRLLKPNFITPRPSQSLWRMDDSRHWVCQKAVGETLFCDDIKPDEPICCQPPPSFYKPLYWFMIEIYCGSCCCCYCYAAMGGWIIDVKLFFLHSSLSILSREAFFLHIYIYFQDILTADSLHFTLWHHRRLVFQIRVFRSAHV